MSKASDLLSFQAEILVYWLQNSNKIFKLTHLLKHRITFLKFKMEVNLEINSGRDGSLNDRISGSETFSENMMADEDAAHAG